MLKLGNKSISNLFIGQKAAAKAFLGQKLVWQKATGLPYDAEVEYLESTGTQYIEVGSIIGATSISITVSAAEIPSSGAAKFYGIGYNANFQDDFGVTAAGWGGNTSFPCTIGESILFEANSDGIFINGTQYSGSKYFINSVSAGKKVFLFCGSSGTNAYITSSGNYMAWRGRIYSCKIMSGTSAMFDFIPVRVGGVGYMYDRVSRRLFGNQGSGNFVVGPDVVEVEYLESQPTGGQYIDTDYLFKSDNVEVTASLYSTQSSGQVLFGSEQTISSKRTLTPLVYTDSGNMFSLFYAQNARVIRVNSLSAGNYDLTIKASNGTIQFGVNGTTTSASYSGECLKTLPIYLFAEGFTTNVSYYAKGMKLYGFTIKDNGVLVRDMVPVRVGMEGAMMDRLTRKIYRNQGTGAFKFGADRKETPLMCNSYVKDGLIAMWDGVENAGWGTHDASATVWKDLVGISDITLSRTTVGDDYIYFPKGSNNGYGTADFPTSYGAIEIVLSKAINYNNNAYECCIISIGTVYSGLGICAPKGEVTDTYDAGEAPYITIQDGELFSVSLNKSGVITTEIAKNGVVGSIGIKGKGSRYSLGSQCLNGGASGGIRSSEMYIKSIRIYSRALTAAEIAANYAIDKARFNLA